MRVVSQVYAWHTYRIVLDMNKLTRAEKRRFKELKDLWKKGLLETAEQIGELCALEAKSLNE